MEEDLDPDADLYDDDSDDKEQYRPKAFNEKETAP